MICLVQEIAQTLVKERNVGEYKTGLMICLVQDTAQTLVKELNVGEYSIQTRRTGLMICQVQDTAQILVEEELDVDQKNWVDDLLGVGSCVDSSGGRTRCRPEGLG